MERDSSASDRRLFATGLTLLVAAGALSGLLATRDGGGGGAGFVLALSTVVATIAVTGVVAFRQSGRAWRPVLISPYSIAALTWVGLFVLRPLELYVSPGDAALALVQLGFGLGDLTRTVALGGLGCAAWCVGYLVVLGRVATVPARPRPCRDRGIRVAGALAVAAAGTLLWFALFLRQGGFAALSKSAVSLRTDQGSSFWGFVGVWMVQGLLLSAFATWLRTRDRGAGLIAAACVPLSVAAAVAVQLRSLLAICALAAIVIYVTIRPVSRRRALLAIPVVAVAVLALGVTQQIRAYTVRASVADAIRLTAHTPFRSLFSSDLSTFDHFVAIESIVPDSVPYLDGRSLIEIPEALVPRNLWPGKPPPFDLRVSSYLYPGSHAGIPIAMQGELYWNGGIVAVVLGALALGAVFGAVARLGVRAGDGPWLLLYALLVAFTHHLLTRALATMFENVIFAVAGTAIAVYALSPERRSLREVLAGARARRTAPGVP